MSRGQVIRIPLSEEHQFTVLNGVEYHLSTEIVVNMTPSDRQSQPVEHIGPFQEEVRKFLLDEQHKPYANQDNIGTFQEEAISPSQGKFLLEEHHKPYTKQNTTECQNCERLAKELREERSRKVVKETQIHNHYHYAGHPPPVPTNPPPKSSSENLYDEPWCHLRNHKLDQVNQGYVEETMGRKSKSKSKGTSTIRSTSHSASEHPSGAFSEVGSYPPIQPVMGIPEAFRRSHQVLQDFCTPHPGQSTNDPHSLNKFVKEPQLPISSERARKIKNRFFKYRNSKDTGDAVRNICM